MFRNAPALCGRLLAASAAAAGRRQASSAAGAAGAAAVGAAGSTSNSNAGGGVGVGAALRAGAASPPPSLPRSACGFSAAAGPTIFDKLGGKPAIKAAVDIFYEKVLHDPVVNVYFDGTIGPKISMQRQRAMQMSFMSYAFGGPEAYKGKDMFEAHKTMDLKEEHFNAIATHFVDTLKELKVDQKYIDEAVAVVLTTKDAILKTGAYAGKA